MQRYFIALGALILVLVSLVADEGGPLDHLTGNDGPPRTEDSSVAAPATEAPAPARGGTMALGSSYGIGDYNPSPDDGDDDDLGYGEPTMPSAPSAALAANERTAKWNVPDGSLTDEQLGVEKATGMAPAGA